LAIALSGGLTVGLIRLAEAALAEAALAVGRVFDLGFRGAVKHPGSQNQNVRSDVTNDSSRRYIAVGHLGERDLPTPKQK
jgi:hypothetical protein